MKKFTQYINENMDISLTNNSDDFDSQNYEYAKWIFEKEESRPPNMNNIQDMRMVSSIEVGIRYTRKQLQKD